MVKLKTKLKTAIVISLGREADSAEVTIRIDFFFHRFKNIVFASAKLSHKDTVMPMFTVT